MILKREACTLAAVLWWAATLPAAAFGGGGDTCASAIPIASLPFSDIGNTATFVDDYDEVCPYTGSTSPDVVYVYTPTEDISVDISLCGDWTNYDTKVYVYENECQDPNDGLDPFACNDDYCFSPNYPDPYVSQLFWVQLTAGNDYYIVVDGYNGDWGYYSLDVTPSAIGACCVDDACVETNTRLECNALGGYWYEGEACPDFECPVCAEDTLEIVIFTDDWPDEITWELREQGGGLIASGGPLSVRGFLYTWEVCLESAKCYDFTIYDSYGDGICCASGYGYYELYLNGSVVRYGGAIGDSETTQVGSACPEPEPCPQDTLEIVIFTDDYPEQTSWELYEVGGGLIDRGGPLGQPGMLYTREVCLEAGKCYDFTIYDSFADGICCDYGQGYYELYLNGELVGSGGEFGSLETTRIGTDCSGACCVDMVCQVTNTQAECDALGGEWFGGEICPDFTCPESCPEDALDILILTDDYPGETTWELYEQGGGLIASGGPLSQGATLYTWRVCLEAAKCYDFTILDAWGDGICCGYGQGYYRIYYNRELICSGGDFGYSETCSDIGGGCGACPNPGGSGNYCTADIANADCLVNLADLAQLLAHYGMTSGATHEDGDLDGDADVDLADLAGLLAQYGDDCN
ncbi:MAG: hypothetical protein ACE5I3_05890 [Phycisphaerae bacterium]